MIHESGEAFSSGELAGQFSLALVESPLLDELLGNWVGHNVDSNSILTFRQFVEAIVPGRQFPYGALVTTFLRNAKHDDFFAALGWSSEDVLSQLSTRPYRARFESVRVSHSGAVPGKIHSESMGDTCLKYLKETEGSASAGRNSTLKICSSCLRDDEATHGRPFFHRAHQLPLAKVCHLHIRTLIWRCPACSRPFSSTHFPEVARRICSCGVDLAEVEVPPLEAASQWGKIAQISRDALSDPPRASLGQWRAYLKSMKRDRHQSLHEIVDEFFCSPAFDLFAEGAMARSDGAAGFSLSIVRAPQICALLAALGLDLKTAENEASLLKEKLPGESRLRKPRAKLAELSPTALKALAREFAKKYGGKAWSVLNSQYKIAFWQLRVTDEAWLISTLKPKYAKSMPSVAEDRQHVTARLEDRLSQPAHRRGWAHHSNDAGIRARLRDEAWFRAALQEHQDTLHKRDMQETSGVFEAAMKSVLQRPGKPVRLHPVTLAAAIGLGRGKVAALLKSMPDLNAFVSESDDAWHLRCIRWVVADLKANNSVMGVTAIIRKAGIVPSKGNLREVSQVVKNELQMHGLPVLLPGWTHKRSAQGLTIDRPFTTSLQHAKR